MGNWEAAIFDGKKPGLPLNFIQWPPTILVLMFQRIRFSEMVAQGGKPWPENRGLRKRFLERDGIPLETRQELQKMPREAQQRRRGGEGQRACRACRAWEGAGEGWNRWKSRRSKIAVSAVWNVNPKDFTNFDRKTKILSLAIWSSAARLRGTWNSDAILHVSLHVSEALSQSEINQNQSNSDIKVIQSQVHPIAINKWNGFWLPERLRDPTSRGSLKCPSPIYWCWWVPLAKASSWRAWV